jgi:hypothetical protein
MGLFYPGYSHRPDRLYWNHVEGLFLGAPLWWDDVHTGYAYSGPLVGALLGFLVVGGLADWSAKFMTRHNHGIYEPEFRIVLVIPQLIIGSAGAFGPWIVSPNMIKYF